MLPLFGEVGRVPEPRGFGSPVAVEIHVVIRANAESGNFAVARVGPGDRERLLATIGGEVGFPRLHIGPELGRESVGWLADGQTVVLTTPNVRHGSCAG